MLIVLSYISYRKKFPELHIQSQYKMPGGLFMAWFTMLFLVFTIVILALDHDTLIALECSPIWFIGLFVIGGSRPMPSKRHIRAHRESDAPQNRPLDQEYVTQAGAPAAR